MFLNRAELENNGSGKVLVEFNCFCSMAGVIKIENE